jgi:hypothetical protein
MSNKIESTKVTLDTVQKYILEHPDKAHPDFDIILDALIKLEQTNQTILAQSDKYPELNTLITSVSDTLKQAQRGLADAAILHESLPNEGNKTRNNQ